MGSLSWQHWLIVAVVVVILFGSKKLPDAARGLGRSLRIFKSEVKEMQSDGSSAAPAPAPAPAAAVEPAPLPAPNPAPQAAAAPQSSTEPKAS